MKSTGIVRKIDELGRIVIPKEIRNVLNIQCNDDLEIYVDNYNIILKKYEKSGNLINYINKIVTFFNDYSDIKMYVTNKEKIISQGDLLNVKLNAKLKELVEERKKYESDNLDLILNINGYFNIFPIIIDSDIIGLLVFVKDDNFTKSEQNLCNIILKIVENK